MFSEFLWNFKPLTQVRCQLIKGKIFFHEPVSWLKNIFSFRIKVDESIVFVFPFFRLLVLISFENNVVEDDVFDFLEELYFILVSDVIYSFLLEKFKFVL